MLARDDFGMQVKKYALIRSVLGCRRKDELDGQVSPWRELQEGSVQSIE